MSSRFTAVLAALMLSTAGALAGPASDAVRTFYSPVGFEADPAIRDRFVDPARAVLDRYDHSSNNGQEIGCIDFVLAIDAQDFDQSEIDRTLVFNEDISDDTANVSATFKILPDDPESKRTIDWTLKKVGSSWKVADIASRLSDWRLSTFDCR